MSVIYQPESPKKRIVDEINYLLKDIKKIRANTELSDKAKQLMIQDREQMIEKLKQKLEEL